MATEDLQPDLCRRNIVYNISEYKYKIYYRDNEGRIIPTTYSLRREADLARSKEFIKKNFMDYKDRKYFIAKFIEVIEPLPEDQ